jgi:hypothetical protein
MKQINVKDKNKQGVGEESEKTAKWPQAGSRDRGVHFRWPHEGRNYHILDIMGPPT